jgi:spectinomycin phosphotransferase
MTHEEIKELILREYGIPILNIEELFLGADQNTRTYKLITAKSEYFLKIRIRQFEELSITVPYYLAQKEKIKGIIQPIPAINGSLYIKASEFMVILFPYISGSSCWDIDLSQKHWREFGDFLASLHLVKLPQELLRDIPRETYGSQTRIAVRGYLENIDAMPLRDNADKLFRELLKEKAPVILKMIDKAEEIGKKLRSIKSELCLCHGDIHAGNLFIDTQGNLYFVDWDTLIFAPKERDLMFIGGGIMGKWIAGTEIDAFYSGYGKADIDKTIISYYRHERIILDIKEFYEQMQIEANLDVKMEILELVESQFAKNNVVDMAEPMPRP